MYIDRIQLENIRGFRKLDFSLARPDGSYAGWTVFTGDNGSGKSSLLRAVAVTLSGKEAALALQPSYTGWLMSGHKAGTVQLEIVPQDRDDFFPKGRPLSRNKFSAKIAFTNGGRETGIEERKPTGTAPNYRTPQRTVWSTSSRGWFSCGYGPFRRIFGASPEATRMMMAATTERFVTMFQEAASLSEADQWLKGLKYKSLEKKTEETQILKTVEDFLGAGLLPNNMQIFRVDSDGLWLRDSKGIALSWNEMSDGYRAALALVSDILRHLIKTYGTDDLTEAGDGGAAVVKRSGVVLIDEIDAHLHPEWQREIGFWLKKHFPHIQFLVTTHSPLICQAADPNGIFVLPGPGSDDSPKPVPTEEYQKIIASKPDTILRTSAFGLSTTRSRMAVEARAEYSRLAAKRRSGAKMSQEELERLGQLNFFAQADED